ncbi:MAG: CoA transferase [Candidatus Protistobacter heckmanni]|nr:CoA transferase [Candidatus Protistobacter heckmanni]
MVEQNKGSLQGVKVVDLSRMLGGPYCTQILGDHGADIYKVEPPVGDETRGWGPPFREGDGAASYFVGVNRNKIGLSLDLPQPAGRELLLTMLEDADVLVENFKTGTMEKWGLYFETLHKRFQRLIHCRVTGFSADCPLGGLPGYDAAIQGMSGIMSVNGESDADGGGPLRVGLPVEDMVTGLNAAIGILLALQERGRSGLGQFVESAQYDCGLSLLHPHAANFFMDGKTPKRTGNAHPNIHTYDSFKTGSDPIFLSVGNDRQFETMCRHIGAEGLAADARFASNALRSQNRAVLKTELEAKLAAFDCEPLAAALIRGGVPCAPIFDVSRALAHPHTCHRGMLVEMQGEGGESYRRLASPIKLSCTPSTYRLTPPHKSC